jgi:formate/nitrite transporter FocA (FNT family)
MSNDQYSSLYPNQEHQEKEKAKAENETQAQEHTRARVPVIYTAICQDGEDELARPAASLWWSGIAAGLAIFFSVIGAGAFMHFEAAYGTPKLLMHLGYAIGFLIVILGRLQLFTENTITAVIPALSSEHRGTFRAMLRLWSIVFAANMIGVAVAACAVTFAHIVPADILDGMMKLSAKYMDRSAMEFFTHGIPAGFIVAALVWMLPSARGSEFWIILVMTSLISMLGLTHVVAGSGEAFMMFLAGEVSFVDMVFSSIIPTLFGNVLGGTLLFTMLAYGQVHKEI